MKGQGILLIIAGGLLLVVLTAARPAIDLSYLSDAYGADNVARLQKVANALSAQGITGETLKYCLAQILQETGIFTQSNANYHATDQLNNYAGISNADGSLRAYPDVAAFATDYIRVLNKSDGYPVDAVSIDDFNARLQLNHYYWPITATYGTDLNIYYNLLS